MARVHPRAINLFAFIQFGISDIEYLEDTNDEFEAFGAGFD